MYPLLSPAEIAEDRAIAEAQMTDSCTISRPGVSSGELDEDLQYVTAAEVVIYGPGAVDPVTGDPITADTALGRDILSGKCRIQVRSDINSNAVEAVVAEHEWTYRTATLQLPIDGTGHIESDTILTMIDCPYDHALEGRKFNVQAEAKGKTHASHRRYRIRELMS